MRATEDHAPRPGPPPARVDPGQVDPGPGQADRAPAGDGARLRVLAFSDYYSESSSGGAERVAREVCQRLPMLGAEVMVLTADPYAEPGVRTVDGIPVLSVAALDLSRLSGGQVSFAPGLPARALRLVRSFRPDVLHAHSLHFQTTISAALCRQLRGIPLVTTAHIGSPALLRRRLRAPTVVYERTVGHYILGRSSLVIAVAPAVADHLVHLGVPRDRIEVIGNGVDLGRFAGVRSESDRTPQEPPLVLFLGRLIQNKGPGTLLDALARLRAEGVAFRAAFVGEGPLRGDLERQAAGVGLSEAVTFAGHSTDVPGWLSRAALLVRPSLTEGMPLGVLEAMAGGVPVVASDIPGNAELIQHGANGLLFPSGDTVALAAMMRLALEDPAMAEGLAAAARAGVASFSWDTCAQATLRVLRRAASLARPAGRA